MDGLRRLVRHGCLPSRGACPGRDDAASEARAPGLAVAEIHSDGYARRDGRSEEHTSELQSLMRNSYAVVCLKKTTTAADVLCREPGADELTVTEPKSQNGKAKERNPTT